MTEKFGLIRLAVLGGTAALLVAGLITLSARMNQAEMGLLFTDLPPAQAQAITEKLRALNVKHQLSADGSAVLAPTDQLAQLRIQLAAEQMTGQIGYELLDNQDALGTTAFLQNVNHIRAIEGELARSIETLTAVQRARVHLVMPTRALFEREKREPSASITLRTRTRLDSGQVAAIRNLVAAAVPELKPERVSMVDQNGTLLAQSGDTESGAASALEDRRVGIEERLRQQVEQMLERIVGPGKVRAEVAAELDFEAVRLEEELYNPDMQVVARQTTAESQQQSSDKESNQAVSVANQLPDANMDAEESVSSVETGNESREEIVYANSRTRTTRVRDAGTIKRLTVSVVVDGISTTSEDGQTSYTPRSQSELEQLTRLVQNAIGFDEERGDSVVVENLQFATPDMPEMDGESSLPMGLTRSDIMSIAQTLVIGLLGVLAFFFVLRPMMKRPGQQQQTPQLAGGADAQASLPAPDGQTSGQLALAPPSNGSVSQEVLARAAEGDEDARKQIAAAREANQGKLALETEIDVAQIEGRIKSAALKKVGEVINRHPVEAAAIIRQWMYS